MPVCSQVRPLPFLGSALYCKALISQVPLPAGIGVPDLGTHWQKTRGGGRRPWFSSPDMSPPWPQLLLGRPCLQGARSTGQLHCAVALVRRALVLGSGDPAVGNFQSASPSSVWLLGLSILAERIPALCYFG